MKLNTKEVYYDDIISGTFVKKYGKKHTFQALKDINFDIQKGEFVAIMGPSGSGRQHY